LSPAARSSLEYSNSTIEHDAADSDAAAPASTAGAGLAGAVILIHTDGPNEGPLVQHKLEQNPRPDRGGVLHDGDLESAVAYIRDCVSY
jgi:hypothetical protein